VIKQIQQEEKGKTHMAYCRNDYPYFCCKGEADGSSLIEWEKEKDDCSQNIVISMNKPYTKDRERGKKDKPQHHFSTHKHTTHTHVYCL
jgi:hypothetical protein